MRKSNWNIYGMNGYTFDATNDQRSAGGVHFHEVRKHNGEWQTRICQSNGNFQSYSSPDVVDDAEGERLYALAKDRK